jgi:DNA-binding response OmpR family regulator
MPRVLLVDGIRDEQTAYVHHLTRAGFEAVTVSGTVTAFDTAVSIRPDVIVADVVGTEAGVEFVRQLRTDARTRESRIIVVGELAMRGNGDVFLSRPCPPETLVWQIRSLLGHAAAREA